jgi:hypothetical protein
MREPQMTRINDDKSAGDQDLVFPVPHLWLEAVPPCPPLANHPYHR